MTRIQSALDFMRSRIEKTASTDMRVRNWNLSNNPLLSQMVAQTLGRGPTAVTASVMVANPSAPPELLAQADHVLQGEHDDFDIKVRAFSMQYANPVLSAKMYQEAITTVVPAIVQLAQAGLDSRAAMAILARKLNEPEMEDLLPDPIMLQLQQLGQQMSMAADQNPTGQPGDYAQDAGPNGRKTPGGRSQNPGPGTGSPRPMVMAA